MTSTLPLQTASGDQSACETQIELVAAGPNLPDGHKHGETQEPAAVGDLTSVAQAEFETQLRHGDGTNFLGGHQLHGDQAVNAAGETNFNGQDRHDAHVSLAVEAHPEAISLPISIEHALPGALNSATDQPIRDAQETSVGGGPTSSGQGRRDTHNGSAAGTGQSGPAHQATEPTGSSLDLADPLLALAADVLDDLERVRIANENRLRQLTRDETDADGEERGFGLTLDHPDVARLAALVDGLVVAEHQAELNLKRMLRAHPLGPWVKQTRGVGEKQAARLLAAIGDPYIRPRLERKQSDGSVTVEPSRPRLVSELWSYTGYGDAEKQVRRRGEKARWSSIARMRTFNISESIIKQLTKPCFVVKTGSGGKDYGRAVHVEGCLCSRYRLIYDEARDRYRDSVHQSTCVRCGPKGVPAAIGSPRSAKHQHQIALRAVSKAVLKDLWIEAKRLHEHPGGHRGGEAQSTSAAGGST